MSTQEDTREVMRQALSVIEQALTEMDRAHCRPNWFTQGKQGADQQFDLWKRKGVEALVALRDELAKPDSGVASTTNDKAQPVAWMDDFGNVFPLAANKGAGSWMDEHKRNWKPLYAAPQPVEKIPFAGYDPKFCAGSNPDNPQPPAEQGERCPDCKGAEFPGFKRGLRCKTCDGTATVQAAQRAEFSDEQILAIASRSYGFTLKVSVDNRFVPAVRAILAADRKARGGAA